MEESKECTVLTVLCHIMVASAFWRPLAWGLWVRAWVQHNSCYPPTVLGTVYPTHYQNVVFNFNYFILYLDKWVWHNSIVSYHNKHCHVMTILLCPVLYPAMCHLHACTVQVLYYRKLHFADIIARYTFCVPCTDNIMIMWYCPQN